MMKDFRLEIRSGIGWMTFDEEDTIVNNIWLSLMVKKGSWWFDPEFGLELPERAKVTGQTAALVRDRIKHALQWLLDLGRAVGMDVYTERDARDPGRVNVLVEAVQADGRKVSFETFAEVV